MLGEEGYQRAVPVPFERPAGPLDPVLFVMGSAWFAYLLWSLMTGGLDQPITDVFGMLMSAFGCTLIGLNGMFPHNPSAPKFQTAARVAMYAYIFFTILPAQW